MKIIAFQLILSLFCKNYRFSKTVLYIINRKIHGCLEIPNLFLVLNMISHLFAALTREISCSTLSINILTTLNISIQTMDCNNLQNSYVLRILCFWGEGDWLGAGGGGGVRNISSPLRGVLNIFRRFWAIAKFCGIEFWNTLHPPPPVHILYDRSLIREKYARFQVPDPVSLYRFIYTLADVCMIHCAVAYLVYGRTEGGERRAKLIASKTRVAPL